MTDPTPTDWRALCARMADELDHYRQLLMDDRRETHALAAEARAALAQPEPQGPGPTDEELDFWIMAQPHQQWTPTATDPIRCHELDQHEMQAFVRAVLARWGRPVIKPVPVSERLPGPEDCDAEGRCWVYQNKRSTTHWLPYWALPVPKSEAGQ